MQLLAMKPNPFPHTHTQKRAVDWIHLKVVHAIGKDDILDDFAIVTWEGDDIQNK